MKPTITDLAKYLGSTRGKFYEMKKHHPKQFDLIWSGWILKVGNKR